MRRRLLSFALVFPLSISLFSQPAAAQLEPPSTGGGVVLARELRMLGHEKRVLMIGAHPDDEDTELLTILVRGMGAEAAYLSLNRGEGGQNLIGPELGEALGLIRTEELLAARRLDGAQQYFTRAYDFGYSKTLEETWRHWPRDTILKDVVRVVRRFRPQIIVSVFSGAPRDGHGQHQAAGWAAREAFDAAGDSTRFAELVTEEHLGPWTPLKLYRSTRFDSAATTLTLEGGVLDPASGLSFHQIAMAGRSLHRSQDMGQLQRIGPSPVRLALLLDRTGGGDQALFAGIDTLPARRPAVPAPAAATEATLLRLRESWATGRASPDQLAHLDRAIMVAAGVVCDARGDDDRVVRGQTLTVTLECWNTGPSHREVSASLIPRDGDALDVAGAEATLTLAPGGIGRRQVRVLVADHAASTRPYFRLGAPQAGLYDWSGAPPAVRGDPFQPPEIVARFALDLGVAASREVTFRFNDQARGEVRRPITIVPRIALEIDPETGVWSALDRKSHRFTVTLTHASRDTTSGVVRLEAPPGWISLPAQSFRFTQEDERKTFTFVVHPPGAGAMEEATEIRTVASDSDGHRYDTGVFTVDYPHIHPRTATRLAAATIRRTPLTLPPLTRIGYIRGAADRVPEALREVGIPVVVLTHEGLQRGDLAQYQAIVVGPRAYETDSVLGRTNARLLDYARRGGLVIVQYQQHRFFQGGYAPFPLTVGGRPLQLGEAPGGPGGTIDSVRSPGPPVSHDRVTDETAPVRVLQPETQVTRWPNRLGARDWEGWVQERGLYFARSWAPAFRPVLETHDPGEAPLQGGLLVASVGRGTYVYTGLSFFRQLPAGVPGAFRLIANILALPSRRVR